MNKRYNVYYTPEKRAKEALIKQNLDYKKLEELLVAFELSEEGIASLRIEQVTAAKSA